MSNYIQLEQWFMAKYHNNSKDLEMFTGVTWNKRILVEHTIWTRFYHLIIEEHTVSSYSGFCNDN